MKPVCFQCQRFFRMRKSGFYFIEGMPVGGHAQPKAGTVEPEKWKPYKVWSGDLWECKGCGAQILSGFGLMPLAIQHEANFHDIIARTNARQFQVNDC